MPMRTLLYIYVLLGSTFTLGCQKKDTYAARSASPSPIQAEKLADLNPPPFICAEGTSCPEAIGQLVTLSGQGPEGCTATLVKPDLVLTASHCVPWETLEDKKTFDNNCWIRWPQQTGKAQEFIACGSIVQASTIDFDRQEQVQLDYAFIRLSRPSQRNAIGLDQERAAASPRVRLFGIAMDATDENGILRHELRELHCDRNDNFDLDTIETLPGETIVLPTCPIQSGYSGGPIFNEASKVITGVLSFMRFHLETEAAGPAVGTRVPHSLSL